MGDRLLLENRLLLCRQSFPQAAPSGPVFRPEYKRLPATPRKKRDGTQGLVCSAAPPKKLRHLWMKQQFLVTGHALITVVSVSCYGQYGQYGRWHRLSTAVCLVYFYQDSVCFPAVLRVCSPQRDMTSQTASSDREAAECPLLWTVWTVWTAGKQVLSSIVSIVSILSIVLQVTGSHGYLALRLAKT
jgi:hypothetical protein